MDAYLTPSSFGTGPQSSGAGREGPQGRLEGLDPPPGPQGGRFAEPLATQNQCFCFCPLCLTRAFLSFFPSLITFLTFLFFPNIPPPPVISKSK